MKRTLYLVAAACLCVGCGRSASTVSTGGPAGPGNLGGPLATVSTPTAAGGTIIEFEVNPIRVEKGKTATVAVIAKRKNANAAAADPKKGGRDGEMYKESYYQGDITLEFDANDAGLKIAPVTIPAGQEKAEATVTANADAAGGFVEVTGKGPGGQKIEPVTIRIRADVR